MTTSPDLRTSKKQAIGVLAVALFLVQAATFLAADFEAAATFDGATGITAAIGYALFNLDAGTVPSEGFLVPFEIIDVVLVAALAAAVMLARRESGPGLRTDGGERTDGSRTSPDRRSDGSRRADDGGDR